MNILKQVVCLNNRFPNSLYNDKLEIGKTYNVVWEGWAWNPKEWLDGQPEYCYRLAEFPPEDMEVFPSGDTVTFCFRGMWSTNAFGAVGEPKPLQNEIPESQPTFGSSSIEEADRKYWERNPEYRERNPEI